MPLCTVTGKLVDAKAVPVTNASVRVRPTATFFVGGNLVVPTEQSVLPDTSGNFTLTLEQSRTYICSVFFPPNAEDSQREITYAIQTPAAISASFESVVIVEE